MIKTKKKNNRIIKNKSKKGGIRLMSNFSVEQPYSRNYKYPQFKSRFKLDNLENPYETNKFNTKKITQLNTNNEFQKFKFNKGDLSNLFDAYDRKYSNKLNDTFEESLIDSTTNTELLNIFDTKDYSKIINLNLHQPINTFNKNKSKFIPLEICYYYNIYPIPDYFTYNQELNQIDLSLNTNNFRENNLNNNNLLGGGYELPKNRYIIDLLKVFDSMHDFCESRGDVKSIKEISETVMGNSSFYDNILSPYGVTKSNIEVKFMEETENIINSYVEEISTSLLPSEELKRMKENKFLLSKFTDDEINVFDDQTQTESYKKTGDQYYIFKVNQNISQIKSKMKNQDQYKINDSYSIFVRSIKKMLNENFPNKKILFEAAAGHDLILRHFVINDKTKYDYAFVDNFIPFQTIFSDASMWDSGNSGNKKVMNAKAMVDEKTGKLDTIVDNPEKCFNNLTLHGLHIVGNESSAKIAIRDKNNPSTDLDKKLLLVKTGPPVSLLSRGDTNEINDTFSEYLEMDPLNPQLSKTSQEVNFKTLSDKKDCSGLAYATVFKRSGDWSQVEYCLKYNCIIYTYDRLCALYAVYRNCPCIFETNISDSYYMFFFTGKKDTKSAIESIINNIDKEFDEYIEIQNYINLIKTYNKEDILLPDINLKYNLNFNDIDYKFSKKILGGNNCKPGVFMNVLRNKIRKISLSGIKKSKNVCYSLEISTNNTDTRIDDDNYLLTDMIQLKQLQGISKATDCEFKEYSNKHTHKLDTLEWIDSKPISVLDFFNNKTISFDIKLRKFSEKFKTGIYLQSISNPFEINLIVRYEVLEENIITLFYTSLSNKGEIKSDCKINCLKSNSEELDLYYFIYSEYLYHNNCVTETTWALLKNDITLNLVNFNDIITDETKNNKKGKYIKLSGYLMDTSKLEHEGEFCELENQKSEDNEIDYDIETYINTRSQIIDTKLILKSKSINLFPLASWYIPVNIEDYKYNVEISDSLNEVLSAEPELTEDIRVDVSKKEESDLLNCSIHINDDTTTKILENIRDDPTLSFLEIVGNPSSDLILEINKPEIIDNENLNNLLKKLNLISNDINQRKELYLSNCYIGKSIQLFLTDAFSKSASNEFIKEIIAKYIEISSKDINNSSKIFNWLSIYKDELDNILTQNSSISSLAYNNIKHVIDNKINVLTNSLKNTIHTKGYGNYGEKKRELIFSLLDKDEEQLRLFEFNNAVQNEIFSLKTLKSKRKAIYVYNYGQSELTPKDIKETINYLKNLPEYKKRIKNFNNLIYQIYSFLDNKHRFEIINLDKKNYIKLDLLIDKIKELETVLKLHDLESQDIDPKLDLIIKDFFLKEYNITIINTEIFLDLNSPYFLNKMKILKETNLDKLLSNSKIDSILNNFFTLCSKNNIKHSQKDINDIVYTPIGLVSEKYMEDILATYSILNNRDIINNPVIDNIRLLLDDIFIINKITFQLFLTLLKSIFDVIYSLSNRNELLEKYFNDIIFIYNCFINNFGIEPKYYFTNIDQLLSHDFMCEDFKTIFNFYTTYFIYNYFNQKQSTPDLILDIENPFQKFDRFLIPKKLEMSPKFLKTITSYISLTNINNGYDSYFIYSFFFSLNYPKIKSKILSVIKHSYVKNKEIIFKSNLLWSLIFPHRILLKSENNINYCGVFFSTKDKLDIFNSDEYPELKLQLNNIEFKKSLTKIGLFTYDQNLSDHFNLFNVHLSYNFNKIKLSLENISVFENLELNDSNIETLHNYIIEFEILLKKTNQINHFLEYTSNEFNLLFNKDKTENKEKFKLLYDSFSLLEEKLNLFNQELELDMLEELNKNDIIKIFIETTLIPIINDIKEFLVLIYHTKILEDKYNPETLDDEIFNFFLEQIKN